MDHKERSNYLAARLLIMVKAKDPLIFLINVSTIEALISQKFLAQSRDEYPLHLTQKGIEKLEKTLEKI